MSGRIATCGPRFERERTVLSDSTCGSPFASGWSATPAYEPWLCAGTPSLVSSSDATRFIAALRLRSATNATAEELIHIAATDPAPTTHPKHTIVGSTRELL